MTCRLRAANKGSKADGLHGVAPDIVTIAKGLGAGYQPVSAIVVSDHIVEAVLQ